MKTLGTNQPPLVFAESGTFANDTFVKQAPVFISTHIYVDYNTIGYFNVREASELTELGRTPFEIACFETTRF